MRILIANVTLATRTGDAGTFAGAQLAVDRVVEQIAAARPAPGLHAAGRELQRILNCTMVRGRRVARDTDCPPSLDSNVSVLTEYNDDGNVSTITATTFAFGSKTTSDGSSRSTTSTLPGGTDLISVSCS